MEQIHELNATMVRVFWVFRGMALVANFLFAEYVLKNVFQTSVGTDIFGRREILHALL